MKYTPIFVKPQVKASLSDMHCLCWKSDGIQADFVIPGKPAQLLRVNFEDVDIVRVLDEMALSTEEGQEKLGLISEHFAYIVNGSAFEKSQSLALRSSLKHYRFITGWTCLDVMSSHQPVISTVPQIENLSSG